MNVKEYLSQAVWLDQRINSKLEQLESLRNLAMKVTTDFSKERVSGGNTDRSPMENTIVKIIDLENEINEEIDKLVDFKTDIMETINQMKDPICQLLLEMRYIEGQTWEEVASALSYNDRTVFKIHGRALKEFEKIQKRAVKGRERHP